MEVLLRGIEVAEYVSRGLLFLRTGTDLTFQFHVSLRLTLVFLVMPLLLMLAQLVVVMMIRVHV